jgi:hypothetical protein
VGALDGVLRSIKTPLEPEEAKELKKRHLSNTS